MRCSLFTLLAVAAVVAVLAAAVPTVAASELQESSTSCGFAGLDFSSLATQDFSWSDSDGFQYGGRVCGVTQAPVCHGGAVNSFCQFYTSSLQLTVLAIWNNAQSATWSYINVADPSVGVQYSIQGQGSYVGMGRITTTVQLVCADTQGNFTAKYFGGTKFQLTLPTPLACGAKPPPKCGWNGLDFDGLTAFDIVGYDSANTYYMHLCSPVQSRPDCLAASPTSAACMVPLSGGSGNAVDVGDFNVAAGPPAWGWITPTNPAAGVGYTIYSTKPTCTAEGAPQRWTTNINLSCAFIDRPLAVTTSGCTLNMTKPTAAACPPDLMQLEAMQDRSIFKD